MTGCRARTFCARLYGPRLKFVVLRMGTLMRSATGFCTALSRSSSDSCRGAGCCGQSCFRLRICCHPQAKQAEGKEGDESSLVFGATHSDSSNLRQSSSSSASLGGAGVDGAGLKACSGYVVPEGTLVAIAVHPALKRWAILFRLALRDSCASASGFRPKEDVRRSGSELTRGQYAF